MTDTIKPKHVARGCQRGFLWLSITCSCGHVLPVGTYDCEACGQKWTLADDRFTVIPKGVSK